jgi:hypothetical protein
MAVCPTPTTVDQLSTSFSVSQSVSTRLARVERDGTTPESTARRQGPAQRVVLYPGIFLGRKVCKVLVIVLYGRSVVYSNGIEALLIELLEALVS